MSATSVRNHREAIEKGARLGYLARAAIFVVIGLFAFRTAFSGGSTLSEREAISEILSTPFGSIALVLLVARVVVFAAIGSLFLTGAARWDPTHPPGLDDGLQEIASWPLGDWLLSATGLGLVAFGIYAMILARYGHIRSPDLADALRQAS